MDSGMSFLFALLAIAAFVLAVAANRRAKALTAEVDQLRTNLSDLHRWVRQYWRQTVAAAPEAGASFTEPVAESAASSVAGLRSPVAGETGLPTTTPPLEVVKPTPAVPPNPEPIVVPIAASYAASPATGDRRPATQSATEPATESAREPTVVPLPAAARESVPPAKPKPPKQPFDWEALVGVKLFSWIAGIALVLAAIFFLRYSVEHGWLSPTVRATIGLLTGIALLVVCELRIARDYTFTVNALDGAGIAILYATLFAIHALWHLMPSTAVFGLMLVVTAVAVMLSIRRDSIFIALLGLLGGFATPALLSSGENRAIGLFSYLLLLNVGMAWVATSKRWPVLTAITVVFTAIYQWAWITKYLTPGQLPLAAAIFIVFGATAAASLWVGRKHDDKQPTFDTAALAGATLPLLFAVVASAVPAYASRYTVLFAFLLMVMIGLSLIAIFRGPQWLHTLGGATAVIVFAIWTSVSYTTNAWPVILAWVSAFVLAQLVASHFMPSTKLTVAPLLFFMFPALASLDRATATPYLLFGTLFVLFAIVCAYALMHSVPALYFVAAFLTIAAEAVWSAKYLAPERLLQALTIYGVFALFFLGIPIVAKRMGRRFATGPANTVLLFCVIGMLFFLAAGPVAKSALWGLALLLAVVNAGALAEARSTSHPVFAAAGILLSWIVIAVWCATSISIGNLVPALAVIGGFALLVLAGNVWASRDADDFGNATFLALAGHMFLLAIAAQKSLSIPPWPLFAVLFVLDLAIGVAAIYARRDKLMVAAMAASQFVLMIWATGATVAPWPNVALAAALAVAAIAVVWFRLNRIYSLAALVALFLGDVVAIVAGVTAHTPLFATLLATHVVILIMLLVIAWITEEHTVSPIAVAFFALATGLARTHGFAQQLGFATALYMPFVLYPLLLGPRAKRAMQPFLGAVLASVPFFFFARQAIVSAGFGYAIGLLPVFQALVMMALLLRLLRIEGPQERTLNRLALVAAAALAFITVAIPLQLEKQWITIAWSLEAAALVWLFTRIPHRGLLLWSSALFAAVFIRLVFNRAVFAYHPVMHTAIVNWYLYTYLVAALAFFAAARFLPKSQGAPWAVPALTSCGTILLFFLVNIEIADFYSKGRTLTFNFFSSSLAQDLTYTIGWAVFAVAMLVAGLILHSRAARVAAILLLLTTVLKCFLHDLARLGGLYRVGSLLGLAASLVLVGVLLQRFVMKTTRAEAAQEMS